jgi:hypothetical protein
VSEQHWYELLEFVVGTQVDDRGHPIKVKVGEMGLKTFARIIYLAVKAGIADSEAGEQP